MLGVVVDGVVVLRVGVVVTSVVVVTMMGVVVLLISEKRSLLKSKVGIQRFIK